MLPRTQHSPALAFTVCTSLEAGIQDILCLRYTRNVGYDGQRTLLWNTDNLMDFRASHIKMEGERFLALLGA